MIEVSLLLLVVVAAYFVGRWDGQRDAEEEKKEK